MAKEPVYEVPADKFILALANELKSTPEFEMPEWAQFVKTGTSKQRPPENQDWWWVRAASVLRQIYIHKIVGVISLRVKYGSKKNRGMKPEKFKRAAGKHIRVILQQAEAARLVEKIKGKRTGRRLTTKGRELLDSIAQKLQQK